MIYNSVNGKKWIGKALEKFKAYANRAPILISEIVGTEKCVDGLFVIHETSKQKVFFPFDFEKDPKVWVHDIKQELLRFYPRLIEDIYEDVELTPKELAKKLEDSDVDFSSVNKFEKRLIYKNLYRIDKVQPFKDIFILIKEGKYNADNEPIEEEESSEEEKTQNRYKFNGSSVLFLNKYRSGKFDSIEEASQNFFENAIFVDELAVRNC